MEVFLQRLWCVDYGEVDGVSVRKVVAGNIPHLGYSDPRTIVVTSPAADSMVKAVQEFAHTNASTHTVVAGGFGVGKSFALGRAVEIAQGENLRVATLQRGPIGISSYPDFLVAVSKATSPSVVGAAEVDEWRRQAADTENGIDVDELERRVLGGVDHPGIVIVIESLDQLLHQIRSRDRPRLIRLLTRASTRLLLLASVHGNGLAAELGSHVRFVQATDLPDLATGSALAAQEARRLGHESFTVSGPLLREASDLHPTIRSSWLFWSLVGRYCVVARNDPLRWAEEDIRSRAAAHFDAMLLTLAPSEQRMLLALAEAGGPQNVGELADSVGVRNQAAATALGRLSTDDWVQIVDMPSVKDRRRTWYAIADPMLRLHLKSDSVS
jgi:hypothetical protein